MPRAANWSRKFRMPFNGSGCTSSPALPAWARERRKFFERMHADFVRYVPSDYRLPGGPRGAKLALIKRDDYLTYELLEPLNRLRVSGRAALTKLRGQSGDAR